MSSAAIMSSIQAKRQELILLERDLKKKEEQHDDIVEFGQKIYTSSSQFNESISDRRTRVNSLDEITQMVKAAKGFQQKAREMLTGQPYSQAEQSINNLSNSVERERRRIEQEIEGLEHNIQATNRAIDSLYEQYYRALEEERREAERQAAERGQ